MYCLSGDLRMECDGGHQLVISAVNTANARAGLALTRMSLRTGAITVTLPRFFFDLRLEGAQSIIPELIQPLSNGGQTARIDVVNPARPFGFVADQSGLLENR